MSKKTDIVKAIEEAPTRAHRILPSSELLVHRAYGVLEKLLNQIEVKLGAGGELTRDDIMAFKTAQQALVELRRDEREESKAQKEDDIGEQELLDLLSQRGYKLIKNG